VHPPMVHRYTIDLEDYLLIQTGMRHGRSEDACSNDAAITVDFVVCLLSQSHVCQLEISCNWSAAPLASLVRYPVDRLVFDIRCWDSCSRVLR